MSSRQARAGNRAVRWVGALLLAAAAALGVYLGIAAQFAGPMTNRQVMLAAGSATLAGVVACAAAITGASAVSRRTIQNLPLIRRRLACWSVPGDEVWRLYIIDWLQRCGLLVEDATDRTARRTRGPRFRTLQLAVLGSGFAYAAEPDRIAAAKRCAEKHTIVINTGVPGEPHAMTGHTVPTHEERAFRRAVWSALAKAGAVPDISSQATSADVLGSPVSTRFPGAGPVVNTSPPSSDRFVGRVSELRQLAASFQRQSPRRTRSAVLIWGVSGVGKTYLSSEYVRLFGYRHWLVWWIPAVSEVEIKQSLLSLAYLLGIRDIDATYVITELWYQLTNRPGWLMVFDGLGSSVDLARVWPPGDCGDILASAQNRAWPSFFGTEIGLGPLQLTEALRMVRDSTPRLEVPAARALAVDLDCMPIAIQQATAYISQSGCTVEEYQRLSSLHSVQGMLSLDNQPVSQRWLHALGRANRQAPGATELMQMIAMSSPTGVRRRFLREAWLKRGPP